MSASAAVKTVDLGEYRLTYATKGSGPFMLMLHGGDKREDWRVWSPLLELSEQYTLVIPDLVGFGASSKPSETPDYAAQAQVLHDLAEKLGIHKAIVMGRSWGGQVALEFAINWPGLVDGLVLISSTYDRGQLSRMRNVAKPALIIWAEDDLVAQVKAGYVLRDALRTSKIQVLDDTAKNPAYDFTIAHKLERYSPQVVLSMIRDFLSDPSLKIAEPPDMEPELRGMAMKEKKD